MSKKPTYEELEHRILELERTELHRNSIGMVTFPELENHSAIILLIDPDSGVIINANIAAQNYYGYSIKTLKQMKIQEINTLSPDEVAQKRKQAAAETLNKFEFSHRLASGEIRTVEVHSSPVVLNHKKLLLSTIHDITDRKQTEEKLKVSEERNRKYVEHSPLGIFVVDSKGKYVDVNPGACELLGYTRDELLQLSISDVSSMNDGGKNFQQLRNEGFVSYEGGLKRKNDSIVKIKLDAVALPNDQFMAFCTDITELKQVEADLKKQRDLFELVIDSVPSSIFWKDLNSVYIGCNTHFAKEAGMKNPEEVIGSDDVMVWGEEADKYRTDDKLVMSTGKSKLNYEEEFLDIEGNTVWWETNKIPLRSSDGKTIGVLATVHNVTIKKMAQNALQESEEKYRNLIVTTTEGFWLLDSNQKTIDVNQSLCDMLGYSRNEMIGKMPFDFFDEENVKILKEQTSRIASTLHRTYEINIKKKNGTNLPTISNATSLIDKNGKPDGSFALVTDITERKLVEEELRLNRLLLRNVLDIVPVFICAKNLDGEFVLVNKKLTDFYGTTVEAMTNVNHTDLCEDENELRAMLAADREVIESGKPIFIPEETMENPDGSIIVLETFKIPFTAMGEPAVLIASNDITERKKAEEEKAKIYNSIQTAVYIYDFVKSKNDYINPEYTRLLGWTLDDINKMGNKFAELFHPDDFKQILKHMQIVNEATEDTTDILEYRFKHKNGQWRWCLSYDTPFQRNANGDVEKMIGSFIDITDRKQAEKEHAKLQNQLQQAKKMESVGRLAGGIAHDFNNILQVIMGHAQVLEQSCSEERDALSVKGVFESARRAADLTKQLLLFSRRQVMSLQTLDFNELVENTLSMIRRIIGEHIKLEWLPGASDCFINADRSMIEQVVMNLCVNARDAMPSGGLLKIETTNELVDSGLCSTHSWVSPGRCVLLSVTDTGEGMEKATMERIFEPFYTTKEMGKGTGIGLATVYGIVKQHKGMILAHSEPGNGSLFKIYLPLSELEAVAAETIPDSYASGGSETILLAEDDDMVRALAKEMLERAGYSVLIARNGHEAISVFRSSDSIDLLLFDVIMPGLGGHGAMTEIRKIQPDIPVLFSSGYSKDAIHTDFVLHKGVMLIQKPYSSDQLLLAVRRALDS